MDIVIGSLYFVSDEFFNKVNDPYLKINYSATKRPHYFAFKDDKTSLYWLIPCSTQVDKYQKIINKKIASKKSTDTIKIISIHNQKSVLLFQDMFPILKKYIQEPYIRGGQSVKIADPDMVRELLKTAAKIKKLLYIGIKFTPTQPDAIKIEKLMLSELSQTLNHHS